MKIHPASAMLPIALAMGLSGCASLNMAPHYERPASPVAEQWPSNRNDTPAATPQTAQDIAWQSLFADAQLRDLLQQALDNNRDLRVAALNIERAQAQYRIQRSQLWPTIGAGVAENAGRTPASVSGTGNAVVSHAVSANVGINAWELDIFGRLRSLKNQALQQYLATEATQQAVRIGLIAGVANAYLDLAAAEQQLKLAQETLDSRQQAYELQQQLRDIGNASDLALRQAEAELEATRDTTLLLQSNAAIARNALELLVGKPLPVDLHTQAALEAMLTVQDIPAGLPSDLLQRRPDILAAEHALIGANANIGAARAAFFPSITLTGGVGRASDSLSSLFDAGNRAWSFTPQLNLPIFTAGRLRANLKVSKVDREIAVADYERAIQSAFRDVADALAVRGSLDGRIMAQQKQVAAAQQAYELTQLRYENGVSSYLEVLDAQRTLFAAQQNQIATQLARQTNLIDLYSALGGDLPLNGTENETAAIKPRKDEAATTNTSAGS